MPVITVTDLENAKLDVQTIAEVAMVGYVADTTTNRNADTIDTLQGRLKLLGFLPPITYAASIVFGVNDFVKTIVYGTTVYFPDPSQLPFTTTGTWVADDELKFFVVQSIGTSPASGITYNNATSGLTATNVQDAIDEVEGRVDTVETNLSTVTTKENNLITLSGVAANATDLGTFTGTTISNNRTNKQALQDIETAYESTVVRKALSSGGSANAITATCTPTLGSLTNGAIIVVKPAYTNTSHIVTFSPDGLTAKNIYKWDGSLAYGDIDPDVHMILVYDSGSLVWRLLNPKHGNTTGIGGGSAQAYDGDGKTFTFAHGLNDAPTFVSLYAYLDSGMTDLNFSSGDRVILSSGDSANSGFTIQSDGTNVYVRVATTGITILNKTTYSNGVMSTASKWILVVKCFA